jgi:hypothetical protein
MKKCFLLIAVATTACNNNQTGFAAPDPDSLAEYYACLASGNFPTEGTQERLVARALDLAERSGCSVRLGEEMEITGRGSVPVSIKISGQEVVINDNLYTPEEKIYIGIAEQIFSN